VIPFAPANLEISHGAKLSLPGGRRSFAQPHV